MPVGWRNWRAGLSVPIAAIEAAVDRAMTEAGGGVRPRARSRSRRVALANCPAKSRFGSLAVR